jgi:hypothetical protein
MGAGIGAFANESRKDSALQEEWTTMVALGPLEALVFDIPQRAGTSADKLKLTSAVAALDTAAMPSAQAIVLIPNLHPSLVNSGQWLMGSKG